MAKHSHSIILPEGKTLDTIEWRIVPGYENYLVSEYGHMRGRGGKLKQAAIVTGGYACYRLWKNTKSIGRHAHRWVALAFLGMPPGDGHKYDAAHNDGNRTNNHFTNIRWATRPENQEDKVLHGTLPRGQRHGMAVLTDEQVREIKRRYRYRMGASLAREFGVSNSTVCLIAKGKIWKHI